MCPRKPAGMRLTDSLMCWLDQGVFKMHLGVEHHDNQIKMQIWTIRKAVEKSDPVRKRLRDF